MLQIPKFEFESNLRPSIFSYPPPTKPPQKETVEKVATAVLSTTAKATARQEKKEKEKAAQDSMDTDDQDTVKAIETSKDTESKAPDNKEVETDDKMDTDTAEKSEAKATEKSEGSGEVVPPKSKRRKEEPTSQNLPNLSRVVPAQLSHIHFPAEGRFHPVRPLITSTIVSSATSDLSPSVPANSASAILASLATTSRVTGGGIIILRDSQSDSEVEYFGYEANKSIVPTTDSATTAEATSTATEPQVDTTGPIAPMPSSFEYSDWE